MFVRQVTKFSLTTCCNKTKRYSQLLATFTSHKTTKVAFRNRNSLLECRQSISNKRFTSSKMSNKSESRMQEELLNKLPTKNAQDIEAIMRLDNIAKSQQDTRDYRGLQLENGMKVLLVSDPQTDVSAAALAVQVGHMSDPENLPGLAHFCEHMLFLGTEKYPHENGYIMYLSQSGGSSNAATYPLMTKYHFHVAPDKLDGALDRFAQFFIAPLFTPSATDREINAVNSEHEKNLSSDMWRIKQVTRHLGKKDHPYNKFGTGNKATLHDIPKSVDVNVRDELLKFHKKWYSANIMSLAVIGKESLNELESMVIEKFSEIKNKNVELPKFSNDPFESDQYATKLMIVPVKDNRSLTINFTTDDLSDQYRSAPDSYLSHLIGHEGKGSILSELRERGWCNDLMAGHSNILNGFGFFEIVVDLTQEGMEHVDDIINIIFQYMKMLREEGPKKWIFDECCKINEMRFRFKDKDPPENFVTNVVSSMQLYPLEEVLTAPYMSNEWEPALITKLLDKLDPKKCRIILVSQSFEKEANQVEPYYKTKFNCIQIPKETLKQWESCGLNKNLALPAPNDFIPTNFTLEPFDTDLAKHPTIILDTPILRVWHKQDDQFLKPKTCMTIDFSNPIAGIDPLNCSLNQMMVMLLKDQLNEYLYDAELAGLKLIVLNKTSGVNIIIKGYSDKQVVLLQKLLDHMFDFKFDAKRFDIIREEHVRLLKNFQADQPFQHAMYYLALILTESAWSNGELLQAMELVTFERTMAFAKDFFSRIHTECFFFGNITKKNALEISSIINKRLENTNSTILPILARQMIRKREYKLGSGDSYLFEKENEFHKNSCAQLYFQCGPQTDKTSIFVSLISQILTEPCYDSLRTKEQLGYIVFCGLRKVNGGTGIRIVVQSTKHPSFVEDRIENFLDTYLKSIEEMPLEEFERHKEALALKKLEKPKTVFHQFTVFLTEIMLSLYHFERSEAEVAILKKITKDEFIDYFKTHISKAGSERRVVAVHIVSTQFGQDDENDTEITSVERHTKISDLSAFKSSKELYPLARPFLDIRAKGARSKL